ncbi:MAG TPA: CPBP family intramembrane glutamic endopeptidase [Thermoanaerobaculia bacterium]|nr:CPBP family intramembrane glutamic endopeptidase [Thermoanaerobaculia bacterium]
MRIDGFGAGLVLIVGVAIPYLAWKTKQRFQGEELPMPRAQFFFQTAIFQLVIYGFALVAASTNAIRLQLVPIFWSKAWPALALLLLALALLKLHWPWRDDADKRRLYAILPRDRRELGPYLLLCVVAAIGEEVTYRGVAYRLLIRLGLSIWVAAAIMSVIFALAHSVQGWRSTIVIGVLAAGFHFIVIYSCGLLPAIVTHFVYDAVAGIVIPRWVQRS